MTTTPTRVPPTQPATGDRELRRAWVAVALIPVFFVLAFAVGEGLYAVTGHPTGTDAPLWADLVAGVPTLAVFLLPCLAAVVYGRRALRTGLRWALVPMLVGGLVGGFFTVLTVITTVRGG